MSVQRGKETPREMSARDREKEGKEEHKTRMRSPPFQVVTIMLSIPERLTAIEVVREARKKMFYNI